GERDLLDRLRALRRALDRELAGLPDQVVLGALEEVGGDLLRLVADLARRHRAGGARGRRRAAGVGAEAVGPGVGVALLDLHRRGRDAELLGDDLRVGGLVPLPLRLGAEARDRLPRRVDADLRRIEHFDSDDVEVLRRTGADDLGEAGNADAHELAAGALLG